MMSLLKSTQGRMQYDMIKSRRGLFLRLKSITSDRLKGLDTVIQGRFLDLKIGDGSKKIEVPHSTLLHFTFI